VMILAADEHALDGEKCGDEGEGDDIDQRVRHSFEEAWFLVGVSRLHAWWRN